MNNGCLLFAEYIMENLLVFADQFVRPSFTMCARYSIRKLVINITQIARRQPWEQICVEKNLSNIDTAKKKNLYYYVRGRWQSS